MEKNIRFEDNTRFDVAQESLIEDSFWASWHWVLILFVIFSIILQLDFFAFALFVYFFSFKFQKNIIRNKDKEKRIKDLSLL